MAKVCKALAVGNRDAKVISGSYEILRRLMNSQNGRAYETKWNSLLLPFPLLPAPSCSGCLWEHPCRGERQYIRANAGVRAGPAHPWAIHPGDRGRIMETQTPRSLCHRPRLVVLCPTLHARPSWPISRSVATLTSSILSTNPRATRLSPGH